MCGATQWRFSVLTTCTAVAGVLSVILGFLFSPIPTRLGFYRWLASREPMLVGLAPAFHHGVEWGFTFRELYEANLTGQTALVTGGNSGLGYEASLALARLGASVTLACLNQSECDTAANKIRSDKAIRGEVTAMAVDLSSLKSVKNLAQSFLRASDVLDMLYLNAGIGSAGFGGHGSTPLSEDGVEIVFATNVLGHHLLYKLLEPLVENSRLSRVILTSSLASFDTYDHKVATDLKTLNGADPQKIGDKYTYGQSKLAMILWAKELTRRLGPDSNVYVNAFNPGMVNTDFWNNPWISAHVQNIITYFRENVMWNATEGALTMLYLGVATEQLAGKNLRGKYFHLQSHEVVNPLALDEDLQREVWGFCDELVKDFV